MVWEVRAVVAEEEKKREAAVKTERAAQQAIAEARVREVQSTFVVNAFNTVEIVREAEDKTSRTPIDKEELRMLCEKDKYCRDRGKK